MQHPHPLSPGYPLVGAFFTDKSGYFPVIILNTNPLYPRGFPIASNVNTTYYADGVSFFYLR
jgi:hypothetical protein